MSELYTLHTGNCKAVLASLQTASVDAVVTDPPYELGFMGKSWDKSGIANDVAMWREVLRVLKPGGHLLSFSATRTVHRMTCAIEDSGFEIRDQLTWHYGQGFPKSLDVSKAIDAAAGAERPVIGLLTNPGSTRPRQSMGDGCQPSPMLTTAATDNARKWQGWGTALKPASEPVVLARKSLAGTVAANVIQYRTGGLNIDACRIGTESVGWGASPSNGFSGHLDNVEPGGRPVEGRWPSNVLFSCPCPTPDHIAGCPVGNLDSQGDYSRSTPPTGQSLTPTTDGIYGLYAQRSTVGHTDEGFPSRFFYVAKPSRTERDAGLASLPNHSGGELTNRTEGSAGLSSPRAGAGRTSGGRNTHPTVKPVELMRYLCRLITPPGGIVLDPFMGSGTTGAAALAEGFRFIGIDLQPEYVAIAEARLQRLGIRQHTMFETAVSV